MSFLAADIQPCVLMYLLMYMYFTCTVSTYTVVQHPKDTTACQGNDATFTCTIFQPTGGAIPPAWSRNGDGVNLMHHSISSNVTRGAVTPLYIGSTLIVNNVTVFDNAALYQCDLAGFLTSNNATLNVVGKRMHTCVFMYVII